MTFLPTRERKRSSIDQVLQGLVLLFYGKKKPLAKKDLKNWGKIGKIRIEIERERVSRYKITVAEDLRSVGCGLDANFDWSSGCLWWKFSSSDDRERERERFKCIIFAKRVYKGAHHFYQLTVQFWSVLKVGSRKKKKKKTKVLL